MPEPENSNLLIRKAVSEDLPLIGELIAEVVTELQRQSIDQWDEIYPTVEHFREDCQAGTLFVSQQTSRLLGVCCVNEIELSGYESAHWQETSFLVVHRLLVSPDAQGLGIGKQLMLQAEEIARAAGKQSLRLDCFSDNPRARHFYERLGYQQRGETRFRKGTFLLYEKCLSAK